MRVEVDVPDEFDVLQTILMVDEDDEVRDEYDEISLEKFDEIDEHDIDDIDEVEVEVDVVVDELDVIEVETDKQLQDDAMPLIVVVDEVGQDVDANVHIDDIDDVE